MRFDDSAGRWITIIGIPSAFLLHGYVGFIFGSLRGLTVYKVELFGLEGLAMTLTLLLLPFAILWLLIKVLPPWPEAVPAPVGGPEPGASGLASA